MPPPRPTETFVRPLGALAGGSWVFGFLLLFVTSLSILSSIRHGGAIDDVSASLLEAASVALVLYGIARVHAPEAPLRAIVGARPLPFVTLLAVAVMGAAAVAPIGELHARVVARFPLAAEHASDIAASLTAIGPKQRIAGVIALSTIGPVVEELLFRGAIATGVARTAGRFAGAVTATAAFALFYGTFDARQLVLAGTLSLLLAHARFATGSLLAPIAAHLAYRAADMVHDWRVFGTIDPAVTSVRGYGPTVALGGAALTLAIAALLPRLPRAEEADQDAPPAGGRPVRDDRDRNDEDPDR